MALCLALDQLVNDVTGVVRGVADAVVQQFDDERSQARPAEKAEPPKFAVLLRLPAASVYHEPPGGPRSLLTSGPFVVVAVAFEHEGAHALRGGPSSGGPPLAPSAAAPGRETLFVFAICNTLHRLPFIKQVPVHRRAPGVYVCTMPGQSFVAEFGTDTTSPAELQSLEDILEAHADFHTMEAGPSGEPMEPGPLAATPVVNCCSGELTVPTDVCGEGAGEERETSVLVSGAMTYAAAVVTGGKQLAQHIDDVVEEVVPSA